LSHFASPFCFSNNEMIKRLDKIGNNNQKKKKEKILNRRTFSPLIFKKRSKMQ
jgi:hypothetical protein